MISNAIVSLVQNIELNKAGWRDKTVQRLVLITIWLSASLPNKEIIQSFLDTNFHLSLGIEDLDKILSVMISQQLILQMQDGTYKIPDQQRLILEKEINESEKAENDAKDVFCKLVVEMDANLDVHNVWIKFKDEFLDPLIKQAGANAYQFIAGQMISIDDKLLSKFLNQYPSIINSKLKTLLTSYLDPKKPEIRSYFSRMLHACFCIDACGLSKEVLDALNGKRRDQIQFKIFVDTNFLFSLIDLHENPSNASVQKLRNILRQLNGNPHVVLYITPETIKEAKSSIFYSEKQLRDVPLSDNFVEAALQSHISGLSQRFLLEKQKNGLHFSVDDWFKPYIDDFVTVARSKGVEIFNEKHDEYSTRQDVLDCINLIIDSEKRLPETRRKSYEKIAHDMILWHYVNDKRPAYVESPIDANYYILTIDFRLINFDELKQRENNSKVPLCIHPTTFIQLLQFWIPRTKEFEEAMLGSLCLPFFFQDLDYEGEKTSLKILKGIGRFDGSNDISEETITRVVFNDGLRSRLRAARSDDEEIRLIKDALVEEMKIKAEKEKERAEKTEKKLLEHNERIEVLSKQNSEIESKYEQEKTLRAETEHSKKAAIENYEGKFNEMSIKIKELEDDKAERDEREKETKLQKAKSKCLGIYIGSMIAIILVSFLGGMLFNNISSKLLSNALLSIGFDVFISIIMFILLHLLLEISIGKRQIFSELSPLKMVKKLRKWLWGTVIVGIILGIVVTLYSNEIQRHLTKPGLDNSQKNQNPDVTATDTQSQLGINATEVPSDEIEVAEEKE
ncbi:hypothetical protein FACS1894161_3430 [Spirochaetia bacterium]|nr:hypothetical protein FACS1894161_3430 [Spirochaetia bacterium]